MNPQQPIFRWGFSRYSDFIGMSALFFCFLLLQAALCQSQDSTQFTIARVKYSGGGDWYSDPTSLPNLLVAASERLSLHSSSREKTLEISDLDLFKYPFLYLTGHGNVKFSQGEIERLRKYLTSGGFLWCDDNGPEQDSLDVYFRRELKRIFPEQELRELPFDHPIYHIVYEFPAGPPKIHEHYKDKPPKGYGLFHQGRLVLYYTWNSDIGDGLENPDVHRDPPAKREEALRMALNIVAYVLSY